MLTSEQIQSLFYFCTSNAVAYYDVQIELVDHLANAIEIEMQANPKITFEKAVEKVHRSFGYRGFESLIIGKKKIVRKQSRKLFWSFFKQQFRWPKVLLFLVLIAGLFTIFSMDVWFVNAVFALLLFSTCVPGFYGWYLKRRISKKGYEFLLLDFSAITIIWGLVPNLANILHNIFGVNFLEVLSHSSLIPVISFFYSLYIIGIMVTIQTILSVKHSLHKNYPEVFCTPK